LLESGAAGFWPVEKSGVMAKRSFHSGAPAGPSA
jgi:hypothetical protein